MKFKAKDRVYYVSNRHSLGYANPQKGTKFECKGVVASDPTPGSMIVYWDNGASNVYSENDLELAGKQLQNNDPNTLFNRRK